MLFTLDICVNKKATPTYSVHSGLNRPSPPTSDTVNLQHTKPCKLKATLQN